MKAAPSTDGGFSVGPRFVVCAPVCENDAMPPQGRALVTRARTLAPGVAAALGVGALAGATAGVLPWPVPAVMVAVVVGLAVANLVGLPSAAAAGLSWTARRVLRTGVVLLGANLALADVAAIGLASIAVVVACMAAAYTTVALLGRLAGIPTDLAVLVGVGTAVCGNSAIAATAPVIDADQRDVSFAVGTITIFGTLALLGFPAVAYLVDMPPAVMGFWAGLSINDTSQVVAAGAAYGEEALDIAVVVKLVRNALMAPVILLIAWWAARRSADGSPAQRPATTRVAVPPFVLGFLALVALRSVGVIPDPVAAGLATAAAACITVALAAIGLSTRLAELARVGARPFLVGLGAATVLAGFGLLLATVVAPGAS